MKKILSLLMALLSAFLLLPNFLFAASQTDDEYTVIEGERRLVARLEFAEGETRPTAASIAALAEVAPMFSDGVTRRYEVHGHFCAGVDGSRAIAIIRAESVVQALIRRGVSDGSIVSVVNPTTRRVTAGCAHDRRVEIMSIDIRRERKISAPPPPVARRGRRTVAVYMAGAEPPAVRGVHSILGGELTRTISANENFIAVDRTDFIIEQLEREHEYQRSGMVDDEQIQALGRQLGVELMCIANITAAGSGYYIDTRLVDIVSAENIRTVTATSSLRDANEKMRVARDIANELVDPNRANKCGAGDDTRYDPAHQFCFGGRAYNFCGGSGFNPQTQGCLPSGEIGTLCADGSVVALGTHCGVHELSVAVAPPMGGSIIRTPDAQTYRADATVALSAVANRGFQFAGWAGAQSSNAPAINVTMTRAQPVIAMFRPENNNMLVTAAFPANGGSVMRVPESDFYSSGETVIVSAMPNFGFEFVGWEGASSSTDATINVLMNEGKTLVAIFRPHLHTLSASASPEIGGSVFINGTALSEATTSEIGNTVEVFARPAPGYVFTGWSGAAFGMQNPVAVDLTVSNVNVIANFASQIADNDTRIVAVGRNIAASSIIGTAAQVEPQPVSEPLSTQLQQEIYADVQHDTTQVDPVISYDQIRYQSFSRGQRLGTWLLNWLIPGLGSFTIMDDNVGGWTQLGLATGAVFGLLLGLENEVMFFVGGACAISVPIYNITRSLNYGRPPLDDNLGFNFSVFPNQDGHLTASARYRLEF